MEWQPIETAPKDENDVLLYFPAEVAWDLRMRTGWWYEGDWYDSEASSYSMTSMYGMPSHWMKLPKPPEGYE